MRPAARHAGAKCKADLRLRHAKLLHGQELREQMLQGRRSEWAAACDICGSNVTEFEPCAARLIRRLIS
jgi:hypothetical protein